MAPKAYVFFISLRTVSDNRSLVTGRNVCSPEVVNHSSGLTSVCSPGDKKADGKEEKEIKGERNS